MLNSDEKTLVESINSITDEFFSLVETLGEIATHPEQNEMYYRYRNSVVLRALSCATILGFTCGLSWDEEGEEGFRPVAYIDLPKIGDTPARQVSWHLREYPHPWDGHTRQQATQRLKAWSSRVTRDSVTTIVIG